MTPHVYDFFWCHFKPDGVFETLNKHPYTAIHLNEFLVDI